MPPTSTPIETLRRLLQQGFDADYSTDFAHWNGIKFLLEDEEEHVVKRDAAPYVVLVSDGSADSDWGHEYRQATVRAVVKANEISSPQSRRRGRRIPTQGTVDAGPPNIETTVSRRLQEWITSHYEQCNAAGLEGIACSAPRADTRKGRDKIAHTNTHRIEFHYTEAA